jgi:hypothetical protein
MWNSILVFGFSSLVASPLMAQGDLLIFPGRIVFDGAKKSEIINLTNIGLDTATYNISFVQIRMTETGGFETITEPDAGQFFADPYIRFYPRTVTIAPNESQVVKMQLSKTNNLPPGEYRSHIYFRAEPKVNALGDADNAVDTTHSLSIKLVPIYGITIPAIIRIGTDSLSVDISNMSLVHNDSIPGIMLDFHRQGNISSYGNIEVTYISPGGKSTVVGMVSGFAVYTPGTLRRCTINLQQPEGVDYKRGKLSVVYTTPPENKSVRIASAELDLVK